jgi:hypothetical protein
LERGHMFARGEETLFQNTAGMSCRQSPCQSDLSSYESCLDIFITNVRIIFMTRYLCFHHNRFSTCYMSGGEGR